MKHLRRITLLAIIFVAALSTFATPFSESDNFNDIPETSDHQSLWQQYAKEAQNGDTEAQYKLALLYYHGKGIKQNYKEAAYWFRKAGSNGHNKAKFYIASMFADGKGVLQDNRIAAEWYWRAAEQGLPLAQYRLALIYRDGIGMEKDSDKAIFWLKKAARQNLPEAIELLNKMTK